jgi:hypothetical protein
MNSYKKWTDAELGFIKDNINVLNDHELANKLSTMTGENITYGMIRRQRRKLGIIKKRGRPCKNKPINSQ